MNKETMMRLMKCAVTLLLLIAMLSHLMFLLERKSSYIQFGPFYKQEKNFDVLFLGTSHSFNGIIPMDLYEQNGIASYNLSTPGCRLAASYWTLRSAMDHEKPKLIVLDCAYLYEDKKVNPNMQFSHQLFDAMPFGRTKLAALFDLFEDDREKVLQHLFPFSLYHSRWDELTSKDFFCENTEYSAGSGWIYSVAEEKEIRSVPSEEYVPFENISTTYLRMIVEECRQSGIALLLTFIPFNCNDESLNDVQYLQCFSRENGIDFLGPQELSKYINIQTDYANHSDDNSHLNISGAHKLSYFLGNYLAENYSIPDRRTDADYDFLKDWYNDYHDNKLEKLKKENALEEYLLLLSDRNFDCLIQICNPDLLKESKCADLLENLGVELSGTVEPYASFTVSGGECLTVSGVNAGTDALEFGNVSVSFSEQGELELHTDNTAQTLKNPQADVRIVVVDHKQGALIDAVELCDASNDRLA